jgi:hypothetical protein
MIAMNEEHFIKASVFCTSHEIEISFIEAVAQHGLISITTVEDQLAVPETQLPLLEKITRLHYDLDINLEGIETIVHLLQRIEGLQQEMLKLNKRIELYEQ